MISLKVLSSAAAIALVLPMAAPSESFAQNPHGVKGGAAMRGGGGGGGAPAARFSGGGGGFHGGGAPAARFSGNAGSARFGGAMAAAPATRFGGAGVAPVTRFSGSTAGATRYSNVSGGTWRGGYRQGYRRGGGNYIPGAVAGAVIGGALAANSYAYYGGPGYDTSYGYGDPSYYSGYGYGYGGPSYYSSGYYPGAYDETYNDDAAVAVAAAPGGDDAVTYCMQTYRSYDPASGTYLGYDGLRHPCP
jgi:hypothetical protein